MYYAITVSNCVTSVRILKPESRISPTLLYLKTNAEASRYSAGLAIKTPLLKETDHFLCLQVRHTRLCTRFEFLVNWACLDRRASWMQRPERTETCTQNVGGAPPRENRPFVSPRSSTEIYFLNFSSCIKCSNSYISQFTIACHFLSYTYKRKLL